MRTTQHATGVMKLTVVSREIVTGYDHDRDEVIDTPMVLINIVDHTTDRFDRGSILLPEDEVANFEYERVRHVNLTAMKRDWSTLLVDREIPPDDDEVPS